MAVHTEISPAEAADRLAIRELFDAYAHCADRRDAEGQKALFTTGTRFAVYMSGPDTDPTYVLEGREALPRRPELVPVHEQLQHQGRGRTAQAGGREQAEAGHPADAVLLLLEKRGTSE